MLNVPAAAALDVAIKRWLVRKYELVRVDEQGRGVYKVHPAKWDEGDLDMVLAWESWFNSGDARKQEDLVVWVQCARDRGVSVNELSSLMPASNPLSKISWGHVGVGVGGALLLHWLVKAPSVPELPPSPIADGTFEQIIKPVTG